MALSELAEIRALLVAQSETVEPRQPAGLLGMVEALLKPRNEAEPLRPVSQPVLPSPSRATAPRMREREPFVLLTDDAILDLELPSPPRAEFGVRSPRPYLPHDSVLLLNKRAPAEPRRLTLLTDAGETVGEIYLQPEASNVRPIRGASHIQHEHEAPYFPGDLDEEGGSVDRAIVIPSSLRSEAPKPAAASALPAASLPTRHGLGKDLLLALALTLSREHDALCDRLMRPVS